MIYVLKKVLQAAGGYAQSFAILDLAKVTFWTKGFVLEETIKLLGVAGGYVQFYRMDVCDVENSMAKWLNELELKAKPLSRNWKNWDG